MQLKLMVSVCTVVIGAGWLAFLTGQKGGDIILQAAGGTLIVMFSIIFHRIVQS